VIGWGPTRFGALTAAACAIALTAPSSASALTPLGATFSPSGCAANVTHIQSSSAMNQYAAPSAGVITSWSHFAGGSTTYSLKLKIARHVTGDFFTILGESALTPMAASTSNGPFPVRIPVQAGDVLGLYSEPNPANPFCTQTATGNSLHITAGDRPVGATDDYESPSEIFTLADLRLDVSAILEPDGDGDGFGDETQDQCVGSPGPNNGCPDPVSDPGDTVPPDTAITDGPSGKTKKKSATIAFSGTDVRAVALFQCKLDDAAFAACTSPQTYGGLKKGEHTVAVRAVDAAGNVDPSPATRDWKVKKKRKKK
jgi:hypothetical protein